MLSEFERFRILRLRESGVPSSEIARCLRIDKRQVDETIWGDTDMERNAQWFKTSNVALAGRRREVIEQAVPMGPEPLEEIPFVLKVSIGFICTFMLFVGLFALALI